MYKILAIDDQQDNLTTIQAVIKSNIPDCMVLTALSGSEGIEIAKRELPDAILLDIIMPQMDGYETCKRLKESNITKLIPVLMVTAIRTDSNSRVRGLNIGADAFVSKPIDPIELSAQVRVMLRIKKAEDKLRIEKEGLEKTVRKRTYELEQSEAKMKSIFRAAPTGIGVTIDRAFQFVNQKFVDISGYSASELIGQSARKIYQTDQEFERVGQYKYDQIREKGTGTIETQFLRKDGKIIDILLSSTPIDFNDLSKGITFTATDITLRKETEQTIQDSQSQLKHIIDKIPGMLAYLDANEKFLYVNKAYSDFYKISSEEIKGKQLKDILPARFYKSAKDKIKLALSGKELKFENTFVSKDGGERTSLIKYIPHINEHGETIAYLATIEDISEQRQSEEAIKSSEERLSIIFDSAPMAYFLSDLKGKLLDGNKAAEELVGYRKEDLIGKNIFKINLLSEMDLATATKAIAKNISGKKFGPNEINIIHKLGHKISVEITTYPVKIGGKYVILGNAIDISDRKKAQEDLIGALNRAQESDRLKSAFLANISHEIRTPMNGILGFSSLLRQPKLSGEKQNKYVDIIEKSGARMLNIINNLVDISKIEAGLMKVTHSSTNINSEIDEIYNFFKTEVEKKGMKLKAYKALPDSKAIIETDKQKLNSIIVNLLKNAIKYSDKGSIEIGYSIGRDNFLPEGSGSRSANGNELVFCIKDTGIGIDKNRQEAIFDRFVQADIEDRDAREGSGLGLSISKAYVELMGGNIWLNSIPGKGSEFFFSIPYNAKPNVEPEGSLGTKDKDPGRLLNKLNILIVEDEEFADAYLTEVMADISNHIFHAKTGIEGVEMTKSHPEIDLILMDIKMPEMNGFDATKKIREFNKEVVIIAQTAYALAGDRGKALVAGCNDYISKPIDPKLLHMKIKDLLES